MIEIKADRNGKFSPEATEYLKGQYSLRERMQLRGVGSSKVVYESGVKEFDLLERGLDTETSFASFELLKTGLIARLNINQRLSCVGISWTEIKFINLVAYRVIIRKRISLTRKREIIHNGKLEIILLNETLKFTVREIEFEDTLNYFNKVGFADKFRFSISTNLPE